MIKKFLHGLLAQPLTDALLYRLTRHLIASPSVRTWLNHRYLRLSPQQQRYVYVLFAKVFRQHPPPPNLQAEWQVQLHSQRLTIPLTSADLWLSWDTALSVTSHDLEIKHAYQRLLQQPSPPRCFLDIGANYGTHSLIWQAHGATAVAFEPNPFCHPFLKALFAANGLTPRLVTAALGAEAGTATLSFDPKATWSGSLLAGPQAGMETVTVPVMTLDAYVEEAGLAPDVIKMDTEGYELQVLAGAESTLARYRPILFLECHAGPERRSLFDWLQQRGYQIQDLRQAGQTLTSEAFSHCAHHNFMALPAGK